MTGTYPNHRRGQPLYRMLYTKRYSGMWGPR